MNSYSESPSNANFVLHSHEHYEIYMFIEGDSKYIVEGNTYNLEPHDVIIIKKHEMHRAYHNTPTQYRRCVLSVYPEFFIENKCEEYENIFIDFSSKRGNKISADVVHSSGIYDTFLRMIKYSSVQSPKAEHAAKATIVELLYLICTVKDFSNADKINPSLKNVISYINANYTENFNLDELAQKFFISKYHICRSFKKITGLTVHEYITEKRLLKAKELKSDGMNLTDAAVASGFNDYSSFYRAYTKKYGISPKNLC